MYKKMLCFLALAIFFIALSAWGGNIQNYTKVISTPTTHPAATMVAPEAELVPIDIQPPMPTDTCQITNANYGISVSTSDGFFASAIPIGTFNWTGPTKVEMMNATISHRSTDAFISIAPVQMFWQVICYSSDGKLQRLEFVQIQDGYVYEVASSNQETFYVYTFFAIAKAFPSFHILTPEEIPTIQIFQ